MSRKAELFRSSLGCFGGRLPFLGTPYPGAFSGLIVELHSGVIIASRLVFESAIVQCVHFLTYF